MDPPLWDTKRVPKKSTKKEATGGRTGEIHKEPLQTVF